MGFFAHEVTLCTSASFEDFVSEHGLQYGYPDDGILKLIDSDAGRDAVEDSGRFLGWIKTMAALTKQVEPLQAQIIEDAWAAAQKAQPDLIIYHPKAMAGPHIAEKLGIPRIMSVPLPILTPTAEFPSIVFPNWPLGGWYNRLTYRLSVRLAWMRGRRRFTLALAAWPGGMPRERRGRPSTPCGSPGGGASSPPAGTA